MDARTRGADTPRRLGELLHPFRWRLALALGLTAAACLFNLFLPLLLQRLIDGATAGADLTACAIALLAAYAAQAAAGLGAAVAAGRVGLALVRDLRHRLYAHLHRLPLGYHDATPAGAVIARVTDDVAAVQAVVGGPALTAVTDLGTSVAVAGLLAWQSPLLFLVAAVFLPAYALNAHVFGRRVRTGAAAVREELDTVFGHLKEKLDGVLVVRASAREAAEVAEFARRLRAAHAPRLRVGRLAAGFAQLGTALGGVAAAAVFAAACFEVAAGRLTPGGAVAAVTLAGMLFGPLSRAADLLTLLAQAGAGLRRVFAVLDLPVPDEEVKGKPEAPFAATGGAGGRIEFDRVTFAYCPGRPVVRDVRLTIEPGTKVAVVGPTGCGKSTLLSLLLRFYEPESGVIRLDGRPLPTIDPSELRRRIGVVPQDAVVFRATVAENIRYGAPDADDGRVRAAAAAALVDDFVRHLPAGYDTVVGPGGHRLSQGERQRLAIARALCKDPALVLLDEATSSLDPAGEAQVQAALDNLLRARTAVVVAHRLATVVNADRIVVMKAGRVVQAGTHAELLGDRRGLYRRLWEAQFGAVPLTPPPRRRTAEPIPA